jgi:hypothetical protein
MTIRILHVADCPLVEQLRGRLRSALARAGVTADLEEVEGPCASPTLLVGGVDVTGRSLSSVDDEGPTCRLDLPTEDQIVAALLLA